MILKILTYEGGGGYIPARILRTFLKAPIKSVSLELYNDETDKPGDTVIVKQWLSREDVAGKNILVVDEVDDTRQTLYTCVQKLREYSPKEIGTYVVFNKTTNKVVGQHWDDESATKTDVNVEHYWPAQNVPGTWLVFPWEAVDIDEHDKNSN